MSDEVYEQTVQQLLKKGTLTLQVKVTAIDEVEELLRWMYATDKPMKSELLSIDWKPRMPQSVEDALEHLVSTVLSTRPNGEQTTS